MKTIYNHRGEKVVLNEREKLISAQNQLKIKNDLGANVDITTLTTVMKSVIDQKFFEIAPADFLPVRVGEGSWSQTLTTYRSFAIGDDFATGLLNTGANNSRLAETDTAVDAVDIRVNNWAKAIGWTIPDLEFASKAGNWDLVVSKEKARKKNWDLGIQKVAFLGMEGTSIKGLLTQAGVTVNTTLITKAISSMTATELTAFAASVLNVYRANCSRTAWPTHFAIPESDYLGLAAPSSSDFPLKSKLELLLETFRVMTKNQSFEILPLAYGDTAYNSLGVNRYALYNSEEDSLRMDIPVDYTSTMANTINGFTYENVGYGQFTGVQAYRPAEMVYFQY
tara:strand:- start:28494 stop:29507 length:1014 start_codon:yes stop_codon:yes gene_type:complete